MSDQTPVTSPKSELQIPNYIRDQTDDADLVGKKQWCNTNIAVVEHMVATISISNEAQKACLKSLRRAKRFLESNELGGCEFEIRMARKTLRSWKISQDDLD